MYLLSSERVINEVISNLVSQSNLGMFCDIVFDIGNKTYKLHYSLWENNCYAFLWFTYIYNINFYIKVALFLKLYLS